MGQAIFGLIKVQEVPHQPQLCGSSEVVVTLVGRGKLVISLMLGVGRGQLVLP